MTPARTRELVNLVETECQRKLARSVSCDDCGAKIDMPCRARHGSELRAEHPRRLRRAERMRDRGEVECSFCQRLQLTVEQRESTAWPAVLAWCADHRRVAEEIKEARGGGAMTTATDRGLNRKVGDDRGRLVGAKSPSKDWVRHRAVRTCAHHAVDAAEFAEWLEMLGLSASEGR